MSDSAFASHSYAVIRASCSEVIGAHDMRVERCSWDKQCVTLTIESVSITVGLEQLRAALEVAGT